MCSNHTKIDSCILSSLLCFHFQFFFDYKFCVIAIVVILIHFFLSFNWYRYTWWHGRKFFRQLNAVFGIDFNAKYIVTCLSHIRFFYFVWTWLKMTFYNVKTLDFHLKFEIHSSWYLHNASGSLPFLFWFGWNKNEFESFSSILYWFFWLKVVNGEEKFNYF